MSNNSSRIKTAVLLAILILPAGLVGCPGQGFPSSTDTCPEIGPGIARFINDSGLVAGDGGDYGDPYENVVFVWDAAAGFKIVGPPRSSAVALNEAGQVLIKAIPAETRSGCLVWDAVHGLQDVGTIGGRWSEPIALNDNGLVLGNSVRADWVEHLILWDAINGLRDIGDLSEYGVVSLGAQVSIADMNNSGIIVGTIATVLDRFNTWTSPRAFVWDPQQGLQILDTLGGDGSAANAINNKGQVVGWSYVEDNYTCHAFLWTEDSGMLDLHDLSGGRSWAVDLTDNGKVLGTIEYSDEHGSGSMGFYYDSRRGMQRIRAFGDLSSFYVEAINRHGQVVGQGSIDNGGYDHALLWDPTNGTQDLGPACMEYPAISGALDINASGQVVGWIHSVQNNIDAYVW
ncbi:MAG: hypothetical protein IT364_00745 [Candidatus Hydrogenedentes bacterium]|nr:hypothetical protein [Candidatus Hydrogenedentota bacterium]